MEVCALTGSSGILGKKLETLLTFKVIEIKGEKSKYKDVFNWINKKNLTLQSQWAAKVTTKNVERK